MKKLIPYASYIALGAGVLGAGLQWWALSAGADEKGLYPAAHPGWIGYLLVMGAALILFFLLVRTSEQAPGTEGSACRSYSAFYHLATAIAIGAYCVPMLRSRGLELISAVIGLCATGALILLFCQQLQKKPPFAPAHLVVCLFFAVQFFLLSKQNNTETQLFLFLPQLFACAAAALASYERMGIAAGDGNPKKARFWSLAAGMLCLAATPGARLMYAAVAVSYLLEYCPSCAPIEEASEEAVEEANEDTVEEFTEVSEMAEAYDLDEDENP